MRQLRAKISRIPQQSDRQLAHMTANYYGMVALIDHNVGRVLSALEERGARDTFVIFTTDHGEMLGNHGLYLKGPWPLDDLLRVGLIVSGPGVAEGRVVEDPVSTLDLAPTFHDLAGVAPSCDLQGTTLKPLLDGEFQHREAAYSEWHLHPSRCGVGLQLRTVRTRNYKCTFELSSGAGELYDLANDPDETINRFDDAAFAGVRDDLYALMRARPGTERRQLPEPIGMA